MSGCHEALAPWWDWHPAVGVFVALLAILGVLVPWFRGDTGRREKAFWTFLMFLFVGLEIRTIYLDAAQHDREQALARCQQLESFQKIAGTLEQAITQSQKEFAETMGEEAKIFGTSKSNLDAVTGGNTFVEFGVVPNVGEGSPPTYPMTVLIFGKYPIRNMAAQIQKIEPKTDDASSYRQLESLHLLPVSGDVLPGPHLLLNERLGVGKYGISIWAANGLSNEELELKLDEHGQLQESYTVRRNGAILAKVKDGQLIFRQRIQ